MSGSNGNFSYVNRGAEISCDKLVFNTQLASPKEDIISQIDVDDLLDITFEQLNGQAVVYARWNGQIAGGIASALLPRLRTCIVEGTTYVAKVTQKQGGQVLLRVSPRNG
ncbi:hypothetical protein M3M50_04910 [Pseudomonas bijieensis]|jgi:hypothetical protein|uniref:hypothetical protein n=1 Tax=Pseudomonas bijieensis TaxID=2681983 RepID=UPI00200D70BC|nr:hypothetical protein [Pseudomonas bijieensis]UQI31967.1 hypothetical protein M3M50_04910 [Pseudomonas bijieensis]